MAEHTPGPWQIGTEDTSAIYRSGGAGLVAAAYGNPKYRRADAALIAQAPALAAENQKLREALWRIKKILWPQRDFASHHSELCEHQLVVNEALAVVMLEFDAAALVSEPTP